jgi:hypothetical protein
MYSEEDINKKKEFLIEQVANTTLGLRRLKKLYPDKIPAVSTLMLWLKEDSKFSEQYTYAKQLQAELMVDEAMAIADDDSKDIIKIDLDGIEIEKIDHEHINRSRLRVDVRKWHASKLAPKLYGDKVFQENDNRNTNHNTNINFDNLTAEQIKDLLNENK